MKRAPILFISYIWIFTCVHAQSAEWIIEADNPDPTNYYGITTANGMVGLVSSTQPMQVKEVVLNGVYDNYQRGRVSNILKTFNHLNMYLHVDDQRISDTNVTRYKQSLNMRNATLVTTFDFDDKVSIKQEMMALTQLGKIRG